MNIDSLREFCLSLPSVTEDIKWENNLVFSVGGKMFCMASLYPAFKISFKVSDQEYEDLITHPGFMPAPYLARAKWVVLSEQSTLHKQQWQLYITLSYELIKAKLTNKLRGELGID